MPYLTLKHSAPTDHARDQRIAAALTEATSARLGKQSDVTAITIEGDRRHWYVGGKPLDGGVTAFYLDILITEGTNSSGEMEQWIADAHSLLAEALGPVAEASYVAVHQVPADQWGFDSITQATRRRLRQVG